MDGSKRTGSTNRWIDVTTPVRGGMVHWPGDPEVVIARVADLEAGDEATVSTISMSAHTGTHVDAPSHYLSGQASLDQLPFDALIGMARVIEISDPHHITRQELAAQAILPGERLLFKTVSSPRCWEAGSFVEDYVHIVPDAAFYLVQCRVQTVGVDYLSVGSPDQEGDMTHRILLAGGIWIIEGLDLRGVPPGRYQLFCLPLRLAGAEGSPARAVLRSVS